MAVAAFQWPKILCCAGCINTMFQKTSRDCLKTEMFKTEIKSHLSKPCHTFGKLSAAATTVVIVAVVVVVPYYY